MSYAIGSLVRARGREWVVLPGSTDALALVRPLGGSDIETTGILTTVERVEPATFAPPDPSAVGDFRSCRLLRDAVRLSTRSATGPFRCFARIAVEPRPYQLVPLMMALRLDPVRLLIADDVGIGKTIEAGLIARELLDRGEVRRLTVLCPPPLAEQWQRELLDKFHIDAELVLASTAAGLERSCRVGQSLFEKYAHTVVSLDFIKSDRRRQEFLRACPELVLVDEAHTCASGYEGRGPRHQRHDLVRAVAASPDRHIVLVTATPHSGKEDAFRSLVGLLDPAFAAIPEDLAADERRSERERLARHFVQRRRADIRAFLDTDTKFPDREERERSYLLSELYRRLFERALRWAGETVGEARGGRYAQRVRWWSVLALLRALGSSPAAAAETLRTRAASAGAEDEAEADAIGERTVMDLDSVDTPDAIDVVAGSDAGTEAGNTPERRRLLEMAREAERLEPASDTKLQTAIEEIKALLGEGFSPVVFCRFIPTAHYVATALSSRFPKAKVEAVTGELPPAEREARVESFRDAQQRIMVCTDCLSEGINLQELFDAVVHYDLSWNPTRHEQREGRVDRYGQPRKVVRALTLYAKDNRIDGLVLDVLITKHKKIRSRLGVSVPVPVSGNDVLEALMEGLLLREGSWDQQLLLPELGDKRERLHGEWELLSEREDRSRTLFAQRRLDPAEVARELEASREAVGASADVARFVGEALTAHGATAVRTNGTMTIDPTHAPRALRDQLRREGPFKAAFELPVARETVCLGRTHPFVAALAAHVMDTALDPLARAVARRSGVIRTRAVARRTTLLLLRFRFDVETIAGDGSRVELCEECRLLAFAGAAEAAQWLDAAATQALLDAKPDANIGPDQARGFVEPVIAALSALQDRLAEEAAVRARELQEAHTRVRTASQRRGVRHRVAPHLPPDLLGVYVLLPVAGEAGR